MIDEPPYLGSMPGVPHVPLTREPIGTSGELSPGPDDLRPEIPQEREELERMGYVQSRENVDELEDFRVGNADEGPPAMRPLFEAATDRDSVIPEGPIFDV